ncbi:MAG: ABC transporter ATP-binding protein [Flavobacterium psychrophilum]|nr:MAG: ABC transporter ATP-binding protein [Flavobacterium psychrophilum]
MITLQNISYIHPNKDLLFSSLNLTVNRYQKIALAGNNGIGKSTLLNIIAGVLQPSIGHVSIDVNPYHIPQVFGQYNHLTIAQALRVDKKLTALKEILNGNATEDNFELLEDDWSIEERCAEALVQWELGDLALETAMSSLSGGQKTKVFLAGIAIHNPELVLMDEPSNHLDISARRQLYDFIVQTKCTLLIVSHDRKLLNLLDTICELNKNGIKVYGGNYDFYLGQKQTEQNALNQNIHSKERELKVAREKERETMERQQKLGARGKGKQEKAGVARIMMNTMRNKAENSSSKMKDVHAEKIDNVTSELHGLRASRPDLDKMKVDFDDSVLHKGKILFSTEGMNFSYGSNLLWKGDVSLKIISGERIYLKGNNGSGKTTLIKLITGQIELTKGVVHRAISKQVYIDQDYSMIKDELSVYEQAQQFNTSGLEEHDVKMRLSRFLFGSETWDKTCNKLSGGERMRLMICCLTVSNESPDIIILDEPTNNLDIQNIEILTSAINSYKGTLIVVSHDEVFVESIAVDRTVELKIFDF